MVEIEFESVFMLPGIKSSGRSIFHYGKKYVGPFLWAYPRAPISTHCPDKGKRPSFYQKTVMLALE
jgi:hypothetical protein